MFVFYSQQTSMNNQEITASCVWQFGYRFVYDASRVYIVQQMA